MSFIHKFYLTIASFEDWNALEHFKAMFYTLQNTLINLIHPNLVNSSTSSSSSSFYSFAQNLFIYYFLFLFLILFFWHYFFCCVLFRFSSNFHFFFLTNRKTISISNSNFFSLLKLCKKHTIY